MSHSPTPSVLSRWHAPRLRINSEVESTVWNQPPMLAAIGGFVIAACLWWLYFSFLESAVVIRGIASVHIFNYGHFPVLVALATIALGVLLAIQFSGEGDAFSYLTLEGSLQYQNSNLLVSLNSSSAGNCFNCKAG